MRCAAEAPGRSLRRVEGGVDAYTGEQVEQRAEMNVPRTEVYLWVKNRDRHSDTQERPGGMHYAAGDQKVLHGELQRAFCGFEYEYKTGQRE